MPAIFDREAFEAAVREKPLEGIGDEHLTRWEKLPEELDCGHSDLLDMGMQVCRGIAETYRHSRMSRHYRHLLDSPSS